MIRAETARKLAEEIAANPNHFKNLKQEIDLQVKKAARRSEKNCFVLCYIPDDLVIWLKRLGYTVERCKDNPIGGDFSIIKW